MLVVQANMTIPAIILHLESVVNIGMQTGAHLVAVDIKLNAREYLKAGIAQTNMRRKYSRKSTGRLSKSIITKNGNTGMPNYARWDVVVNTGRAPYAMWVELGRYAPKKMLPYANSDDRDYSKSTFLGHKYLTQALKFASKGAAQERVYESIFAALASPVNYAKIGNMIEV